MPYAKQVEEILANLAPKVESAIEHAPTLPKGGMDIFPLETPHIGPKELPLTADTPEELTRLKKMMTGTPEEQSQLVKEYAQQAGAKKEKQLEDYFAKKQSGEQTGSITDKLPGTSFMPTKSEVPKIANPAEVARKAYDWYNQKLEHAGNMVANKILQTVTPQGLPNREQIISETAPAVSLAAQLVGDPTNYIGGGEAKLAANAIEKAPGVLGHGAELARASAEALVRQKRAEEAMRVLNQLSKEPSTAKKLAAKGAQIVQPVGPIIRSR